MIKTLILIRHSKAEDRDNAGNDIDRPLTKEGIKDSEKMANILMNAGIKPDLIISSSAIRAAQTAKTFLKVLKTPVKCLNLTRSLYYGSAKTILDNIYSLPETVNCVIIIAHNPGISDLVRRLSEGQLIFMENTQVIVLKFEFDQWLQLGELKPISFQNHRVKNIPV